MKNLILVTAISILFTSNGYPQVFGPLKSTAQYVQLNNKSTNLGWKFRADVVIPMFKITPSKEKGIITQVNMLTDIGGGLQLANFKNNNNGEPVNIFSFSPFTVLVSGDPDQFINLSWASTIGFHNNIVQMGVGYDFGKIDASRIGRWFFLLSAGIEFNK